MDNVELLAYYRELREYHTYLKKHVQEYFTVTLDTQKMLKYRAYDLARTEKLASKDREECDVYNNYAQNFIH